MTRTKHAIVHRNGDGDGDGAGDGVVLFAYDGSDQAKASIRAAARQLRGGREAVVVTVWEPLAGLLVASPAYASPEIATSAEREARSVARKGARIARSVGFRAKAVASTGSPVWRAIVESAGEHDAGIVVMGSHGRTGVGLVLLGSVAAAVARHAERPVLIVHPPAD